MSGFPEHVFEEIGDDPRCINCGDRADYLERAVRPCLASEELRAKFWHDGVAQYGLRVFGEVIPAAPMPIRPKKEQKPKKPSVPTLF